MENMRIIRLAEIRLSENTRSNFPDPVLSIFATLAFAANEVTNLQAFFLMSKDDAPQDDIIKKKSKIQKFVLTRALNAKVFEAFECLDKSKMLLTTHCLDDHLPLFLSEIFESEQLKSRQGFEVAKAIRNHATNHYIPQVVYKNRRRVAENGDHSLYLHQSSGDSFYPFGEEFVFGSLLNKIAKDRGQDLNQIVEEWMNWSISASSQITKTFEVLARECLERYAPSLCAYERTPYLEPELDGGFRNNSLPLFYSI